MTRTVVAVVAPRYLEIGGMQNYARRVVAWLQERPGYEVVVVTTHEGRGRRETEHEGVRVIQLGTWFTLSNTPVNPLWFWQLRRLFRRLDVSLINAHSPVPYLADVAIAAAGRRPTVLTYHAGSLVKGSGGLVDAALRWYERAVLPRVFRRATRVVGVSPVAAALHAGPVTIITPGVDTDAFVPPAADVVRECSVTFVGRVETTSRWKGLDVLVDALPELAQRLPEVHLDVVGDGDAVPDLQARAAALGVAGRIRWHGSLPQPEVNAVLQRSGVAVLPSLTEAESFGMALIEAMAAGCPVVGSAVGGIPHVIRDGVDGVLVPPGDARALAGALGDVLCDPASAARLGRAGREAAELTWDWRCQQERTMDELQAALGSRARHRATRLAVVTDSVAPWNRGGKEQRQHELLTRLAARGVQVDVYTMRWWGEGDTLVRDGITYHALCRLVPLYTKGRRSILQALVFALATLRVVTRPFDVLEVDSIPFLQLYPARVVAWLRRRPMVTTWHEYWGPAYWTEYLGPLGRVAAFVERMAIRLPDRILAASDGTAERLREVRPDVRDVQVVENGIAADVLRAAGEPADGVARAAGDPLRLVSAGRLLDHKKVDVAIRATAVLAGRGVAARLTVIGDGPESGALQKLAASEGVADRVEFLAFLPHHSDVLEHLAAADLLAFPSVREGFGMVALEAMAVGTPVITSDHPDNFARHLIEPGVNGIACPAEAVEVADAVLACAARLPELSAGAVRVAGRYDWEAIADKAMSAYTAA